MATKASGRKASPKAATNPISELLKTKTTPRPIFDKAEIAAVQDFHRKQMEQLIRKQFERETNEIIKPRLDQLEAARKAKPDSPLGILLRKLPEQVPVRAPTRPEFNRHISPRNWTQSLSQRLNYNFGQPTGELVWDANPPNPMANLAGALSDPINGRLFVGVRDDPLAQGWEWRDDDGNLEGDQTIFDATLWQTFSPQQTVAPPVWVRAEADITGLTDSWPWWLIAGAPDSPLNGLVGVSGYVTITIYAQGVPVSTNSAKFLSAWTSATPSLNSDTDGSLIIPQNLTVGTETNQVGDGGLYLVIVGAYLRAYRGGYQAKGAGSAGVSYQNGMKRPVGLGMYLAQPLVVPEMRLWTGYNLLGA